MNNSKVLKTASLLFIVAGCIILQPVGVSAQADSVTDLIQQGHELGMDPEVLSELQTRAQSRGINDEELASIIKSAVDLAGNNLPSDHLIQKALEGISKGVPGARISMVLDIIRNATEQSAQIVEPWLNNPGVRNMMARSGQQESDRFKNELIKSASRAIGQEVPGEVISDVLAGIGDESVLAKTNTSNIVTAVGILPDLPTTAAQPEVSKAFVVRALKGGFGASELQRLPSALNIAQMRSQLPAASVIQGVADQLQGGIPAAQVLQNLFDGNIGGGPPGNIPKGLENKRGQGQRNG